jgi:hypothetical protein
MKKMMPMLLLTLGGCQSYMERAEMEDDRACQKVVADRNDARPEAYAQCRANFQQYRHDRMMLIAGSR